MSRLLELLSQRVLLCDGGTGALVQEMNLSVDKDFMGLENCTDILVESRPDVVRDIARQYYAAGADMVETNSFGASPITLEEFGVADKAFALNKRAGELAREAAETFSDGRERFVLGSIGPGTKLPSLGHVDYDSLEKSYLVQMEGLAAGGVDAFLIETCQDPLQIKAAVNGAKQAALHIPIFVQVTVETTGTLLVGTDLAAAATVVQSLDVPLLGLNCAAGPQEMQTHLRWLTENWTGMISILPNAGLPELVDGKTHYPLLPDELAIWHERFVKMGANILGGCCGTTPAHIAASDAMLRRLGNGHDRPSPVARSVHWVPSVASLFSQVSLRQENSFLSIGERCNANGSRKFRDMQDSGDWDGIVSLAREQIKEGSNTLDICTAFVGRDEVADMQTAIEHLRGSANAPLVVDSTELPVLEAALKLYGGKAILNSINFEDGEQDAEDRLRLARKFGAAVVALTIDEEGMAKTVEDKLRVARRLYDFAVVKHGLPASDLLFDPLTFTICTGSADDRKLALYTLEAIEKIQEEMPECGIILGLSNVSFGLKPAARQVLNSVFIDHAIKAGMTGAIVHISKIIPLHTIAPEEVKIAEDLIFDRSTPDYDPLQEFIALFGDRTVADRVIERPADVKERLKQRIVDGDRTGLADDINIAMEEGLTPLSIINELLLSGMKVVGELFGSGKMQLPIVLQSAETMKAAVSLLEPHIEKSDTPAKATMVLATVKGDVHDIGKNLVDIILTNNGYRVINLGIKQPISEIIAAAKEHKADVVGMSGLLVKSTVIMKDNLQEMAQADLDMPVILGGAALTRKYVEEDCRAVYPHQRVAYARDAFDGLDIISAVAEGRFDEMIAKTVAQKKTRRPSITAGSEAHRPVDWEAVKTRRADLHRDQSVIAPPFWGSKIIEYIPLQNLLPFLNETMLYQFHWGYRKQGKSLDEFKVWAAEELRPIAINMLKDCSKNKVFQPQAVYGYWPAASDGDDLVIFETEDHDKELVRMVFPRQSRSDGLCLADFFRPIGKGQKDVVGLQAVTIGEEASRVAMEWFQADRYKDYLYLHGLGVETTEAMAEYVHKRIRSELGFAAEDAAEMNLLLKQNYRGCRYSFGYPACPDLEQQTILLKMLGAERNGLELTDNFQLHPEQTTSALVCLHPQAKYFTV